jgi:hypothetical protein
MSGEPLRHARSSPANGDPSPENTPDAVTPELLRRAGDGSERDSTPEEIMDSVAADLVDGPVDSVPIEEELVTQSLDEILMALIALRDDETHGTGLMADMEQVFDVCPSPGTVYPRLHDLDEGGTLSRHDLVQTKQYAINDEESAESAIENAMYQHLAVGLFLRAALDAV